MKFSEIPRYTEPGHYQVNVDWQDLNRHLNRYDEMKTGARLDLNPDFQRGHVWTKEQQIAYVEFKLRGGTGGNIIYFNCVGWMHDFRGPFVLVDGLQRLTAVRRFITGEIKAFGQYVGEFIEPLRFSRADFLFNVNNLETRAEVLQWYLEMNTGGTPHTDNELQRVRNLLMKEKENTNG